jgi:penicillin amidase
MMKMQADNYNLKAAESLPLFLSYLDSTTLSPDEANAYHILKSWDYYNHADSEGASYYEAWWDQLTPLLWDEMNVEGTALSRPTTFNTIWLLKQKPDFKFFDIQNTPEKEQAKEVLQQAFKLSVKEMNEWKSSHNQSASAPWAEYKDSYVGHLLRLEPLSIPVKHGGNHDIVNAHSRTHGPSWRMVVSLEKSGIKAWGVYPGGQSGNPGSYHYSSMLNTWAADKHFELLFLHSSTEAGTKAFYTTTFNSVTK